MDLSLHDLFRPELGAGEKILWAGQPSRPNYPMMAVMMCGMTGLFLVIGAIVFIGTLASGNYAVAIFMFLWTAIAGWNFYVGLNMILAPMKQRYAITNERVIIIQMGRKKRVASIRGGNLSQIERSGTDAVGTLDFGKKQSDLMMFANAMKPPMDSFMNIENPRKVENLISDKLLKKAP